MAEAGDRSGEEGLAACALKLAARLGAEAAPPPPDPAAAVGKMLMATSVAEPPEADAREESAIWAGAHASALRIARLSTALGRVA